MTITFEQRRELAMEILRRNVRMTRKSGSFCGQLAVDPTHMTEAQEDWFGVLLERAELEIPHD